MQLPEATSAHAATVDAMNEFVHLFMLALCVGWTIFFFYCLYRFWHKRHPKADYVGVRGHASSHVEVAVVIIEAILLIGFALPFWAQRVEAFPSGPDVVNIRATAYRFGWAFHYPGADGKFGRVHSDFFVSDPAGLDRQDPNAFDDIVSVGTMLMPVDKPVLVTVASKDVIHNLSMVPLRVSQDAMPGAEFPTWFTPTKTGTWEIICGQLCGEGHSSMKAFYEVKTLGEFEKWKLENAPKPPVPAPVEG
ncbi:MAG: cytochrome c oxidase subunit 2 [Verrucomicrobiales bacterium]|jgi:cytochrome c oxidase subunit 2